MGRGGGGVRDIDLPFPHVHHFYPDHCYSDKHDACAGTPASCHGHSIPVPSRGDLSKGI